MASEGKADRIRPRWQRNSSNRKVDVVVCDGPGGGKGGAQRNARHPDRHALDLETDPVASGLVRSLGRPGGNVTGLFLDLPSLAGKRLELLGEAACRGRKRVGVLVGFDHRYRAAHGSALRRRSDSASSFKFWRFGPPTNSTRRFVAAARWESAGDHDAVVAA